MKPLLANAGALVCGILWAAILAPLIANAFGVPCKFVFLRIDRQNRHISRGQYFWFVGVFGWGLGMFVMTTVSDLLQWKFLGNATAHPSLASILSHLLTWSLGGMIFGYVSAPKENAAAEAS
ncbi:MAG TPA: hypothetical protein VII58_03135 [Acidobacteriaceae bacterium]